MSQRPGTHVPAVRAETEKSLGITQRSAAINFSWTGDIRKRYTDFLVNEIRKDGTVLHLRDYEEEEAPPQPQTMNDRKASSANLNKNDGKPKINHISEDDRKAVAELLGETVAQKLIELDENIQAKKQLAPQERTVAFDAVTDRTKRATIHHEIRRIFRSRFETTSDAAGVIKATAARWANNSRAAGQSWGVRRDNNRYRDQARAFSELGGEYLHFTLYKENKDTMDAVNTIARLLKIKASNFGFAGTKDRRAATVQRISVYHQKASNLIWLNSRIPNVKVGDFAYSPEPLQLGQHGGNEFVITLKNCEPLGGETCSLAQRIKMIQQAVECGLAYLKHHGYINYYGLQRFGTYSIGTHLLGKKILMDDFEGFIDDILHVDDELIQDVLSNPPQAYGPGKDAQNSRDDHNRARAITTWKTTKNAAKALEFLPKRFSSETAIIRHLGKNPRDFVGAVLSITRGMRMMYVHAYQSYVWNFVATRRWAKYGAKVIEGDLVLVTGSRRRDRDSPEFNPYEDSDDDNIYAQARALTAADVASGKYTIFDVVLPTPGYDVSYPRNEIGDYYVEFMGRPENGSLSPYEMRRKHREFSLSGNYRPLIGRLIGEPQYAVRAYRDDTEQMYPTDLDYALHKKAADKVVKAAALAKSNAAAARDAALDRWAHFSQNPSAYDDAMAVERRRKAGEAQEPRVSERPIVTNETWVQTGVDGSAKRVKLARHHQQIESQSTTSQVQGGDSPTVPAVQVDEAEKISSHTPFPVGNGAPLFNGTQDASPPRIITDGPIPMIQLPKGAIPTSGIRGVSDSYYASTGQIPYFGPLPEGYKLQTAGNDGDRLGSQQSSAKTQPPDSKPEPSSQLKSGETTSAYVKGTDSRPNGGAPEGEQSHTEAHTSNKVPGLSDLLDWYGKNLPTAASAPSDTTDAPINGAASTALVKVVDEDSNDPSDAEVINGIPLPKLRSISDNPLSAVGNSIDEKNLDPEANKIAVILKFQLKASNYATIVLRELMGTTAEELTI